MVDAASMTPPKTPGPRGTVQSSVPQSLVNFIVRAIPFPAPLRAFFQQHHSFIRALRHDESGGNDGKSIQDDPVDVEGHFGSSSSIRSSRMSPTEFWSLLDNLCKTLGGEWVGLKNRILAFGPGLSCGCILIDAREGAGSSLYVLSIYEIYYVLCTNIQLGRETLLVTRTPTFC